MINALELFDRLRNSDLARQSAESQLRLSPIKEQAALFALAKEKRAMEDEMALRGALSKVAGGGPEAIAGALLPYDPKAAAAYMTASRQDRAARDLSGYRNQMLQFRTGVDINGNPAPAPAPSPSPVTAPSGSAPTAPAAPAAPGAATPPPGLTPEASQRWRLAQARPGMAGGSGMNDDAVNNIAVQSLYDPNATVGFRRDAQTMGRINNRVSQIMKDAGITPEDVVSGRAGFKADTMSLNKITPQYDAITAFEKTALRNGKILTELVDKADTTGVPFIEKWVRAGRKATGDPDVAKFDAQINAYRAEVARILTQPNLSGVLTDTARKEAEEFLQSGASPQQIKQVVSLLERDFNNRKETLEEQIGNIRGRMSKRVGPGGGAMSGQPAAAPAAMPPSPSGGGWSIRPKQVP